MRLRNTFGSNVGIHNFFFPPESFKKMAGSGHYRLELLLEIVMHRNMDGKVGAFK